MANESSRAKRRQMRQILISLEAPFAVRKSFKLRELVRGKRGEAAQEWFRYREGFSANFIRDLLKDVPPGELVVDPFCGVGTTLTAARNQGFPSLGIDINPLAVFASIVKTRQYSIEDQTHLTECLKQFSKVQPSEITLEKPLLRGIDRLFIPEMLQALLIVKNDIDVIQPQWIRDFLSLGWIAILEELSNVKKDSGSKYRHRKRLHTGGYLVTPPEEWGKTAFPPDKFEFVKITFIRQIQGMVAELEGREGCGEKKPAVPIVVEGSALELDHFVKSGSVSLIVGSAPYPNTLNYIGAYKLELWMAGFIKSYQERKRLNQLSLRSHLGVPLSRQSDQFNNYPTELDLLIDLMEEEKLWHPGIPQMLQGYFWDMGTVLEKSFAALKSGGRCILVVGTSAYENVVIPTDLLLATLAQQKGFQVERIGIVRHLPTSSQQSNILKPFRHFLRESVLFLIKP